MSDKIQFKSAKLAVLIDADNATPDLIEPLLKEIAKYGIASIRRLYGDWSNSKLHIWKSKVIDFALRQIQQCNYASGKNSTDIALIIDAMDLLHTEKLDGFCIVSGDSDYTSLAIRLREAGLAVFGFGEKAKTSKSFFNSCNQFIYTESLTKSDNLVVVDFKADTQSEKKPALQDNLSQVAANQKSSKSEQVIKVFTEAYEASIGKDGWVNLMAFNESLMKLQPTFNSRKQHGKQFKTLVKEVGIFDHKKTPLGTQIKLKQSRQKA